MGLHIAADLDGTISFAGKAPAPELQALLGDLSRRAGVAVTIATARSPRVGQQWFAPLMSSLGWVCCNGAIVADGRGEIARRPLDPLLVRMLVSSLRAGDARFCLEYGDRFAASHDDALPWMGAGARIELGEASPLLDGVVKLSIAEGALWSEILALLVGSAGDVFPHATGDADIVARGVDKSSGLQRLLRPGDRLLALGNDRNDLEMLLRADAAIVVGDRLPGLDACSHVRRVPSDSSAVAAALETTAAELLAREEVSSLS